MAEKRVSVRLVAEGGRQVRAELEGVGAAGARGFGRLSREMDMPMPASPPLPAAPRWLLPPLRPHWPLRGPQ